MHAETCACLDARSTPQPCQRIYLSGAHGHPALLPFNGTTACMIVQPVVVPLGRVGGKHRQITAIRHQPQRVDKLQSCLHVQNWLIS